MGAAGVTLHYATTTTTHAPPGAQPPREPERQEGALRISVAADELIVDDGESVARFDFAARRRTILDTKTRTTRESSLLAHVQDREVGMASALHVLEVMRAAGAIDEVAYWSVEAAYAMLWRGEGGDEEGLIIRDVTDDGWCWRVGERELTRVRVGDERPPSPSRALLRLMEYGLRVHPTIAAQVAELGVIPAVLTSDDHFVLQHRVRRLELTRLVPEALDFAALTAGCEPEPPADEALALLRRSPDEPSDFRLDDAREALGRGARVEALLAVFAHNWAFVANTGELVAEIFKRAGWFSPVKRILKLVSRASSEGEVEKQLTGLEKLRAKAGRYDYALDVLLGEKLVERDAIAEANAAFASALRRDPGLAATWVSLGRTYTAQRRYADGWDCFERADQLCPQHPVVGDIHKLDAGLRARHGYLF
ncbi:MAG: hypothetical protein KC486_33175 [Myxococcales bacterium]|nr:hypothetical protein [Myxococcales bacterium]